jgi:dihydropteroate synthase
VPGPVLRIAGIDRSVDRPLVMGVVNTSPESFSDPGCFTRPAEQRRLCAALVEAGADVLDIGGQSAITNQPELDAAVEADRVVPLVEWVRTTYPDVLVSVDTYKPAVVEAVLDAGAHIINDVSGLRYPEVAGCCARAGAALVVMHTVAPPKTRLQDRGLYDDVVAEVVGFLAERVRRATDEGLPWESVVVDPGPDFTKTPAQTVALLRGIDAVWALGRPVLLALSRKDFLGAITGRSPRGRDAATAAAIACLAARPGGIVRVHDVAAAVDVIATVQTLQGARDVADDYVLPEELRHEPRRA